MKYLFEHWDRIKERIKRSRLMLFLDFDGTLAPIAQTPEAAILPAENRELLKVLATSNACTVVIVSGRALDDVKHKIGLEHILYVGNHGLEVSELRHEPEYTFLPHFRVKLERVREELIKRLTEIAGVVVEDKKVTVAIHYRMADTESIPRVAAIVHETVLALDRDNEVRIAPGKMVLELCPTAGCDKGAVVSWLLAKEEQRLCGAGLYSAYIGDDRTDEDAFKVLKNNGLTVFVGPPGISQAEYYLSSTQEVSRLLRLLVGCVGNRGEQ